MKVGDLVRTKKLYILGGTGKILTPKLNGIVLESDNTDVKVSFLCVKYLSTFKKTELKLLSEA
jgi:hypothetical protein